MDWSLCGPVLVHRPYVGPQSSSRTLSSTKPAQTKVSEEKQGIEMNTMKAQRPAGVNVRGCERQRLQCLHSK